MAIVSARKLSKRFAQRWAVQDLDLEIGAGETFVLIGPSGCGKTTTLRMLNRLVEPSAGRLEVLGQDVTAGDPAELRKKIGYVIQDVGLFPHYTVRKNVAVVPELLDWPRERIEQRVSELLALLGLPAEEFGERYPHELSGGQRQRVGIARALAADPPLVLLDEPFGALDPITRESVQEEFLALSHELEQTFVLVTHDVFEAVRLADRIGVMAEGRLVQVASPAELVRNPASEVVRALLGRHRFQLRLMTTTLQEAAADAQLAAEPGDARALSAEPSDSVWSVLDRMESESCELVSVELDGRRQFTSRQKLLEWS